MKKLAARILGGLGGAALLLLPAAPLRAQALAAGAAAQTAPPAAPAPPGRANVKIEITGLRGGAARNVRTVLRLARAADQGDELPTGRIRQLFEGADDEIAKALEPFGFYHPRVRKTLTPGDGTWTARFAVDPGPPVVVRAVNIHLRGPGAADPAFQALAHAFPLRPGDTLRSLPYDTAKVALLTLASDSGYLTAAFDTSEIRVDTLADTAAIEVRFETGPRYRFGAVTFDQTILDTNFLKTRIPFHRGDWFRQRPLMQLQANLAEDPYFSAVEVLPHVELATDSLEVPIEVRLTPRPPRLYEGGVGYGTDTGPRGTLRATFRRLNRHGNHAEVDVTGSLIEQSVQTQYTIPAFLHPTGELSFVAGFALLNPSTSSSRTWLVGPRLSRRRFGLRETFSLIFQREGFQIGVDSSTAVLLTGGASWERTRADNRIFPTHGLRTRLDLTGGYRFLIFNATFFQARLSGKFIRSLGARTRLITRAEAGHTFTGVFRSLPPTLRFFAGGDQSVRGYGYEALGPRDQFGDVIGGPNLLVGSVEADYRVLPRWAVAAFYDAGNATNGWSLSLKQGTGLGVRWISPIGLIRLDGAYALNPPAEIGASRWRIHFSMGPDL
ncbi:MAG TPA: autotransporter assembly complex family protein [Gemmatimonadales bacterium]|nr:autotransporter assembly complex family protein [Gemmatimonadales bacterium]